MIALTEKKPTPARTLRSNNEAVVLSLRTEKDPSKIKAQKIINTGSSRASSNEFNVDLFLGSNHRETGTSTKLIAERNLNLALVEPWWIE